MDLLNHPLNRRLFAIRSGKILLWMAISTVIPMSACNWVAFLVNYIPMINHGIDVISGFFGIFLPPGLTVIITAIKAALLDLQGAAIEYQSAPAADKATILGRIETFLKGIVDNFQQVLDSLGATGPIPAIILGVINIILSTLTWLVGRFSHATSSRMLMPMRYKLRAGGSPGGSPGGSQVLFITPVERSQKQFMDDINNLLAANGRSDLRLT